ncbi:hypothetical protein V6N13_007648 [Hibiscus sabdariffa]|uniref:Uncharacterized protein n=1 Tax=Hibiscus sabdariffa TaxID=183260 RepID=A0ABR2EN24_9ROSI
MTICRREVRGVVRAEMFSLLMSGLKLLGQSLKEKMSLRVVRRLVQAVGVGIIRGVKPDQQLVKILHDELMKLMGGEVSEPILLKSGPTVILFVGLQSTNNYLC